MRTVRAAATWLLILCAVSSWAAGPTAEDLVTATAARLDALHISIYGSADELRAAERLNYHRIEDGTAACMRAGGHPYGPPPFDSFYRDFTDADVGYGTGSAGIADSLTEHGRRVVLNELSIARVRRAEARRQLAAADVPAYNDCTAPYEHRSYYDIDLPSLKEHLGLDDLLVPLAEVPGLAEAWKPYRDCMKTRYGYEVEDRDEFLFASRINAAYAPLDGAPPSAAWTHGVAALRAAFTADAECRRPAYAIAMRALSRLIAPWERAHRAQLDAVRQEWRRRVAEAARLPR
jgi:hypothetical protein